MKLIIGNKNYSSWSFRAWLGLAVFGVDFETDLRPFDVDNNYRDYFEFSPTGKVPVLQHNGQTVWESLAILEYAAERFPEQAWWPSATVERTLARCVAHEMHAGFFALRSACPMNMRREPAKLAVDERVTRDVARVETIWRDCLDASGGPFLFGAFTIADAMYAPVVNRLQIYRLSDDPAVMAYGKAMNELTQWQRWATDAADEPWVVAIDEV